MAPEAQRVTCVLNGLGRKAPEGSRRSRGVLPLTVAEHGKLERAGLADFDPFHLLSAEPERAVVWSWDGEQLAEREMTAGLHIVVNSGLDGGMPGARDHEQARIVTSCRGSAPRTGRSRGCLAGMTGLTRFSAPGEPGCRC